MLRHALTFAVLLAAAGTAPVAAQNGLAGSWRGTVVVNGMRCTFDRVIVQNGNYSEIERCGPYATGQSGTYHVFANHTISFIVADWTPKQRYVVGAYPGMGHYEDNARPPGGTFQYSFTSPNTMVWRDVNFGGTIVYRRVR